MKLNTKGSLITKIKQYNPPVSELPLCYMKYVTPHKALEDLPKYTNDILMDMIDIMSLLKDSKMHWLVDYKVVDLRKGDCGVKLEGWHLDCVSDPWHKSKPETHLLFSTDFGTEYIVDELDVKENEHHFCDVLNRYNNYPFVIRQAQPYTITQYGRFNLHRAPIVTKDCRRMTLRLTQTEIIKSRG